MPSRQALITLGCPSRRALADLTTAVVEARGPVHGTPALDASGTVHVAAANRVHAYLVGPGRGVWRVPRTDLHALKQI